MLTRRKTTRERFLDAMEAIVARGEQPTLRSVAAETGLAYGTVYGHSGLLDACYGDAPPPVVGLGREDKESIEARTAAVREAKVRIAPLGGLDKGTLDEILPD